jgi:hypothetical protein
MYHRHELLNNSVTKVIALLLLVGEQLGFSASNKCLPGLASITRQQPEVAPILPLNGDIILFLLYLGRMLEKFSFLLNTTQTERTEKVLIFLWLAL